MIVRVTTTEFETSDGRVIPHFIPFDPDEVPTVEEFQRQYNRWHKIFEDQGLMLPASGDENAD